MTTIELSTIVEVALRRFGCQVAAVEENLFQAAIPANSPLRRILDVDETAYLALVQFEEDRLAGLDPVRHLIPGSIYLERFIGLLTEHGAVGDVTLPAAYERPDEASVRAFVEEAVPGAGRFEVAAGEVLTHRCVTFHFVVDLFAVEASKTLVSITYDFDGRRLVGNPDTAGLRGAAPAAVEIDGAELLAAAGAVMENVRAEACRQIEAYAEEHGGERVSARQRLRRLARRQLGGGDSGPVEGGGPDGEEREELAHDWEQRIRHADSQYRAEGAQVTLVSATRQLRPFAPYAVRLGAWGAAADPWPVLYDLTCGSILLPPCRSCDAESASLVLGEGLCSHPLCERCAEVRPSCLHVACRECTRKCASCAATVCKGCGSECIGDDCTSTFCEQHKTRCLECERCACARHRQFCRSCQKTFCGPCFPEHHCRQADCGHPSVRGWKRTTCHVCKSSLCQDCAERCQHCGHFVCHEHAADCLNCRRHVCGRCGGPDCEACGARCCKEHSFPCKVCGRHSCYEHAGWCAACSRAICADHTLRCRWCFSTFCPKHGRGEIGDVNVLIDCQVCEGADERPMMLCDSCFARVPHKLLKHSGDALQLICVQCRSQCPRCGDWLREFEFGRCAGCGVIICDDCLGLHVGECDLSDEGLAH